MSKAASIRQNGLLYTSAGQSEPGDWWLAEEMAVAMVYNDKPHGVMMASPADLEDMALGFAIGEQVITDPKGFVMTRLESRDNGYILCSVIDEDYAGPGFDSNRAMEGRSGCGLCGAESLDQVVKDLPVRMPLPDANLPGPDTLTAAFSAMANAQIINRQNHSVHAAAFCKPDGDIVLVREDVGRHNALDKLTGACLQQDHDPATGFVLVTSRCSFELVQKAVLAGYPLLASLGAPTAMARDLAAQSGLTLAARGPGDSFMMFRPDVIAGETHPASLRSNG